MAARRLHLIVSSAVSQSLAKLVPDNGGSISCRHWRVLGARSGFPGARHDYGITRRPARTNVRAALESMCYRTRDVVDAMTENCGPDAV